MPLGPSYINALSANVNGSDIELKFEIDPNSELENYKVLKSDSYNGVYNEIETIIV